MPRFFNGASGNIKVKTSAVLNNLENNAGGGFTYGMWIKLYGDGQGANGCVLGKGTTAWAFEQSTPGGGIGGLEFDRAYSGATSAHRTAANTLLKKWQFLCLTWSGSPNATSGNIFVDFIIASYILVANASGNKTSDSDAQLTFGDYPGGGGTANIDLAFVQVFDRILNIQEFRQIAFFPGSLRNSLKGFWPLFGDSNIEPDYSGNGNHGIVTGTTKSITSPPIQGLYLPKGFSRHSYVVPAVVSTNVTFDAASSSGYEPALSTYTWNHTIANHSNRFLEVSLGIFALGNGTSVTFNGKNLSFVRADVRGVYRSEIWRMVAPDVGTFAIVVTLNTSLTSIGNAQSYYNVDQSAPIDIEGGNNGTNTPASGTITTEINNCVVLGNLVASTASGITSAGGQTSRTSNNGALGTDASDDTALITPPGSKTLTWNNLGALDSWAVSMIAIQPVQPSPIITPQATPKKFRRLLMGVGL